MEFTHNRVLIVIGLISSLTIVGCKTLQQVYNVDNHPINQSAQQKLTDEQISTIIGQAGASAGWRMEPIKAGLYRGTIRWKDHSAAVDILYTRQYYSIKLDASYNLKEKNGTIHPKYNEYAKKLEDEIDRQILRATY